MPDKFKVSILIAIGIFLINVAANGQCTTPEMPVVTTPINYCQRDLTKPLSAIGENLKWYRHPTQGIASESPFIPSTYNAGTASYYVSQTVNGCESQRQKIDVMVKPSPLIPLTTTTVGYCQYMVATPLEAEGVSILWYESETGGAGDTIAPLPVTELPGITSYYVSQTIDGCESERTVVDVIVFKAPDLPIVVSPVTYCQNSEPLPLTAEGIDLIWYSNNHQSPGQSTAYVLNTLEICSTNYYVTQTVDGCESLKAKVEVIVEECSVLATTEAANSMISIYPNPTSYKISAVIYHELNADQLLVIDKKGNVVFEQELNISSKSVAIDVHELETGTYSILILKNAKIMEVRKFVKE